MIYRNNKNRKGTYWLKIGAWIFGIALFLFAGLFFLTNWVENKLERMVAQESDGVYKLSLYGLQLSPFIGNVSVDSMSLAPDYERWQELNKRHKDVAATLIYFTTRFLDVKGLNYMAVLLGRDVAVDDLLLSTPEVTITSMREDSTSNQEPLHAAVPGRLKGLQIERISLADGKFSYRNGTDAASVILSINKFSLKVRDMQLDSTSFQAQDRAYYAANIEFKAKNTVYHTPDGLYRLTADTLHLNSENRTLQAQQVRYSPTTDPGGLARAKGEAVSYINVKIPFVSFKGLDFPAHSRNNNFLAKHLLVREPALSIFKDKKNFENKSKTPLLHEMVQKMQAKFLLDTVELKNGHIRYEEIVPEAAERGHLTLEKIDITVSNLSNMPAHISKEHPAVAVGSGMVMGKVPARMTVRMPLLDKNGYHTLRGEVDAADPEILNPIIAPTAFLRIKSGQISRGSIDLELTNDRATGTLHLIYNNFEVALLSKGTGGKQSLGKEILSKLANWVAIKESNPSDEGEQPRVGEIDVERNELKSMFSYWTDSIIDGFISIATIK